MTNEHWDEIGQALSKANDGKWPTENQRPFADMSDVLEYDWLSGSSLSGSWEPYEFSWLTRKLFGWLLKVLTKVGGPAVPRATSEDGVVHTSETSGGQPIQV